ncbi:xanthine dehydrogenase family protein molybdopterin-binding subunit [Agrobacterium tumefaciens]|uniref:Xanthine dehydrogenase n=1 Tax=Agrobacterium tumefaciens TaxID=358 RepID=A0A176XFA1_AGRTU|nr:xanthine dehydrogenase family protein molybdopterin-binding subunit [Agrobacterium tumefaciens]OAE48238.1 xanthine dehydrogenase [Agrobacterium tumefaciens]
MDEQFPNIARVDAVAKVTGAPIYAADRTAELLRHAVFLTSSIAKGKVSNIDVSAARASEGVRLVITFEDKVGLKTPGFLLGGGYAFQSLIPLQDNSVHHYGQPIALIVADTLEQAVHARALITVNYLKENFASTIDSKTATVIAQSESPLPQELFADTVFGDAEAALATAAEVLDLSYYSPPQHQNPMELVATVAMWQGEDLTIYEGTQNSGAIKFGVAQSLGISPDRVTVVSPHAGGGFGQKNSMQIQTALMSWAARELQTPIKMVVPREQLFANASFRPESRHRVRIGADEKGTITSVLYDVDAQSSRHDIFPLDYTSAAARLYGIPNFKGFQRIFQTDVQTPGYMRAPYEHFASFVMDTAVDEMAERFRRDPVEYRMSMNIDTDPISGLPLSSRFLNECLSLGSKRFDWRSRNPKPQSMRAENGDLVGLGVGCGCYKAATAASVATLSLKRDGTVSVSVGVHEMGQGIRTALANAVARKLNIGIDRIEAVIGDTRGAPQHLTAGSWGTATAVPAVEAAAEKLLDDLGPDPLSALIKTGSDSYDVRVERLAPGQPQKLAQAIYTGRPAPWGPIYGEFVTYSYIAHFVEVRVEPSTMRIRVPRVVSVADCGQVVSPRTAESQVKGGVVWGIGAALREASEVDARFGGFLNADIAEYLVPVNADIGQTHVEFVNRPDPKLNDAGIKGLGEVVMTGVAAAITNAVWHATGRRLRKLPIRIEDLL